MRQTPAMFIRLETEVIQKVKCRNGLSRRRFHTFAMFFFVSVLVFFLNEE